MRWRENPGGQASPAPRAARDSVAEQVKITGEPVTLEPMNPADRRTVHLALERDTEVHTNSVGEGLLRRLVISPSSRRE